MSDQGLLNAPPKLQQMLLGAKLKDAIKQEMTLLLDQERVAIVRKATLRVSDRVVFDEDDPKTAAILVWAYAVYDNVQSGLDLPSGEDVVPFKTTIAKA